MSLFDDIRNLGKKKAAPPKKARLPKEARERWTFDAMKNGAPESEGPPTEAAVAPQTPEPPAPEAVPQPGLAVEAPLLVPEAVPEPTSAPEAPASPAPPAPAPVAPTPPTPAPVAPATPELPTPSPFAPVAPATPEPPAAAPAPSGKPTLPTPPPAHIVPVLPTPPVTNVAPAPVKHEIVEGFDDVADVVIPPVDSPRPPSPFATASFGTRVSGDAVDDAVKSKRRRQPKKARGVIGLTGSAKKPRPAKPAKAAVPFGARRVRTSLLRRPRVSLVAGFKDPIRRPRYILITGMTVLGLAAFMIVALGVTSTRWFCSEGCHKVQDDTIVAYQHSSHAEISCMACHMPVNSDPVTFILHKAEALGELYLTVTDEYELPLNGESHVALTMPSEQCTQCHDLERRTVSPAEGIEIDHKVHAEHGVECTVCHNRVAHREDFDLVLKDPATNEPNRKHEDFMSMTACFRCHNHGKQLASLDAPGECAACHPKDFQLKPASHLEPGFFPKGHAKLGAAAAAKVESATAHAAEGEGGHEGTQTAEAEPPTAEEHSAEEAGGGHGEGGLGTTLPKTETINECSTCHSEKFCSDCHGLPMPHPANFREGHGEFGKKNPKACVQCHGAADRFCDDCHHSSSLGYTVDTRRTWLQQHFDAVEKAGAGACVECHEPTYCARCHTKGYVK